MARTDVTLEATHICLMREDWMLVPEIFRMSRRNRGVAKTNIAFTAPHNVVGLSLAALGILTPILAATAQSLPNTGIPANSSRLPRRSDGASAAAGGKGAAGAA